ncbi:MAG: hypothetical protein ACO37F_13910, partial [Pirellulales bacterium]
TLDVHALPERIRCLAPSDFSHIKDLLRYSSIWRSLKRAYGARFAFAEFQNNVRCQPLSRGCRHCKEQQPWRFLLDAR